MNKITSHLKVFKISLLIIIFCISVLVFLHIILLSAKHNISYYYNIIRNQEKIRSSTVLDEKIKKDLLSCKKDECFRSFFDDYTMKHGPEEAFSLLALFQKEYPEKGRNCHYISHGIGHGSLRLNANNVSKSFDKMNSSAYFKNVATCGNGYFHGVIEEYAKSARNKDDLIGLLKNICTKQGGSCYHGVGHAVAIQLDGAINDSLSVCDAITTLSDKRFECYTGIFMEESHGVVSVENGIMKYEVCDSQKALSRTACYLEHSSLYERYTKEPDNYIRNIGFCKQISDAVDRMACIKLFAIRSVRIVKFENVHDMCVNTSSKEEKVMCTSVVALRIAQSVDSTQLDYNLNQIVWDVCTSLTNPFDQIKCFNLATNNPKQTFYTSEKDLTLPRLSLNSFSNVYKTLVK